MEALTYNPRPIECKANAFAAECPHCQGLITPMVSSRNCYFCGQPVDWTGLTPSAWNQPHKARIDPKQNWG